MKRMVAFLLTMFMVLSAAGCGNNKPAEEPTSEPAVDEKIVEAENLALNKTQVNRYEWDDMSAELLVQSEYSYVTLCDADSEKYPAMAEALNQISAMLKRSMADEADNLLSFANEEKEYSEFDDTYVSTLDIQIRRADSIAVSLLSDSYSDYGMIEEYRGMVGFNFDTETGKELLLSEVIKNMEKVPAIVEQELNSHIWAGDFYSETTVTDYFRDTPEDEISWTLDYNGVTFYFADGDLAEQGNGRQTATVSFDAYPELFNEKYMNVPDGYIVSLPLDNSFFTDLDGDTDMEELNCSGYFNSDMGMYSSFGIYTDLYGHYNYEEMYADEFAPYYVKTAEGNHYIYLFCKENEGAFGQGILVVYEVNGGEIARVGEKNALPFYLSVGDEYSFIVPTDPAELWLDDPDFGNDGAVFAVGEDGMPYTREESTSFTDTLAEIDFDEMSLEGTQWYGYMVVDPQSGEELYLPYTDQDSGFEFGAKLELNEDGTGYLDYKPLRSHLTWYCEDNILCLQMEDGWNCYGYLYDDVSARKLWLMLQVEEDILWMNL